ncbi:MAG: pantetheine-phosphate adenylyltransferase [Oscillatoriales cyanobacterium SM2_2_1]|nr:pantetheine-phosphate adenylyltransferase [Oscillatoriales cyanobacterium SM2_2_1]
MTRSLLAVYPGSFDPVTFGHLDIIHRASRLFDGVTVTVLNNPSKQPLFSLEERMAQLRLVTADLPNVTVDGFAGLTVDYARLKGARVLIRGLRAVSDFELELQMAHTNKTLAVELETCFLATSNEYSFLSSSVVKQIARFGGPVEHLVPQAIAEELRAVFPLSQSLEK